MSFKNLNDVVLDTFLNLNIFNLSHKSIHFKRRDPKPHIKIIKKSNSL